MKRCPYRHCVHDLSCTLQGFYNHCPYIFGDSEEYEKCEHYIKKETNND